MPAKDRTFSSKDIIRIIDSNLTGQEQAEVLISVCKGIKIEDFGEGPILVPITSIEEALEEQDISELIIKGILKLLRR